MVDIINFLFSKVKAQKFEMVIECGPATSGGKDYRRFSDSNLNRIDDFIVFTVLQNAILVNT